MPALCSCEALAISLMMSVTRRTEATTSSMVTPAWPTSFEPRSTFSTESPITWSNFNYTVIAVVVVLGFAVIYWLVSARKWFTGPRVQGTAEELAAIERELTDI